MQAFRAIGLVLVVCVLAGCRTRIRSAPATPAPSRPVTSIARPVARSDASDAWTTTLTASPTALRQSIRRAVSSDAPGPNLEPGPWELYGYAVAQAIPGADIRGTDASVDTWIQRLRLELEKRLANAARLSFDLVYERADYDFDSAAAILPPGNDPIDPFHSVTARARLIQPVSEQWAVFLFTSAAGEAEEGAEMTDGMSYAVTGGIGHLFKNGLQLGLGAGFIWRPAEPLLIIPALQFVWEVNDHWELSLDGPEFEAKYSPNDCWAVSVAVGFRSRRARLDDGLPGNHGIFTDSRIPAQLRVKWYPTTRVMLELRLGVDVYREFFFEDRSGDNIETHRLDPAPNIGLRFRYKF